MHCLELPTAIHKHPVSAPAACISLVGQSLRNASRYLCDTSLFPIPRVGQVIRAVKLLTAGASPSRQRLAAPAIAPGHVGVITPYSGQVGDAGMLRCVLCAMLRHTALHEALVHINDSLVLGACSALASPPSLNAKTSKTPNPRDRSGCCNGCGSETALSRGHVGRAAALPPALPSH